MQQQYQHKALKMLCKGMSLSGRFDLLQEGKFPYLQNVRVYSQGEIRSRPTLRNLATLSPPSGDIVHSIKTLVDKALASFTRISGAGASVYAGNGNPNLITGGFSGKPLSIVDFRPEESISPYAYIADELKMVKISSSNVLSPFGLTAPKNSPTVAIDKPSRKTLDNFTAATIANWTGITGSAGAAAAVPRFTATTIAGIVIDEAVPSFASIIPTTFWASMQEGAILSLGGAGAEDVVIEKVMKAVIASGLTTVSKITYDVGVAGLCTITLTMGINDLEVDSVLRLNGTEYVRVLEIIESLNNQTTFRTKTVGTIAATNSVEGFASFRAYIINSHAAADSIAAEALKTIIGAPPVGGISGIDRTFNIDLTNTGTRTLKDDDIFHLSLLISDNSKITEIQIQLDVDEATNDFTKNYFYKAISPNLLTASALQTIPTVAVQQQATQRREVWDNFQPGLTPEFRSELFNRVYRENQDNIYGGMIGPELDFYNPVFWEGGIVPAFENETALGLGQWTEVTIPLKDFTRVGSDLSKGLKDVKKVRITVNATAAVDLYLDSMWVGGGYGLSNISTEGKINPYSWVYCYEEAATKAVSDWSPANRNGLFISRGRARLLAEVSSELTSSDRIIWARFGGNNNDFRVVGVQKNDGSFFYDEYTDSSIAQNQKAIFGRRKPFAILDVPRKGVVNVNGNKVTRVSGDNFNTAWALGSQIIIDNIPTHLYTNPTSTTALEIEKDLGAKTNVDWYMPDALLVGQPLPIIFGPFALNELGLVIFGLGDKNAAGKVYWLDPSTPDTQNQFNFWEVCSPAEPLMNGVMYDGLPFVWSTERSYMMIPSFIDGKLSFYSRENANSKGLFARYGICVGNDFIYYIASDGIYKVQGVGNPISITDEDLYTLFPHSGSSPAGTILPNGDTATPPDYSQPDEMWLFHANKLMFFRFKDILGNIGVLVYDTVLQGWISYDKYDSTSVGAFYAEEGDSNYNLLVGGTGKIFSFSDIISDETVNVPISKVLLPSMDMGDSRVKKLFAELIIDASFGGGTPDLAVTPYYDNNTIPGATVIITDATPFNRHLKIIDIDDGGGVLARNISALLEWEVFTSINIYEFQPYYLIQAETINRRILDFDDVGDIGEKYWEGIILTANTNGDDVVLAVVDDDGISHGNITINHPIKSTIAYPFNPNFIAHQVKLVPDSSVITDWEYFNHRYVVDKESELASYWESQETTHDLSGFQQLKKIFVAFSSMSDINFHVIIDGAETIYSLKSSAGLHRKIELIVKARKGKLYKYKFVSNGKFRLYRRECEVLVKSCGSPEPYQTKNPFGEDNSIIGTRI